VKQITIEAPIKAMSETSMVLEELIREGARKMLKAALEAEIAEHLSKYQSHKDETGRKLVVRNGYQPERTILTGAGPISVTRPRVDDRILAETGEERFTSRILQKFMRRAASIDSLVPALYLKGISTDDFPTALEAILGPNAKGLSATTVVRLKEVWADEYEAWSKRDLSGKRYVYLWADGVYCAARLEDERSCLLVIMGADSYGNKELPAVCDGAMGFQAALAEVWPTTKIQRCWFHKSANILDKLPSSLQGKAKHMLHDQYLAPTKEEALKALSLFIETFGAKYPKAVECLAKDKDDLFAFYDFPAAHWMHLRTANPIESTFATVRLTLRRTKGNGTRKATLTMVYKLCKEAEKGWRKLQGFKLLSLVEARKKFKDGKLVDEATA